MKTKRTILIVTVMSIAAFLSVLTPAGIVLAQTETTPPGETTIAAETAPSAPTQPSATEVAATELAQMTAALSDLMANKERLAAKKDELTSQISDLQAKAIALQSSVGVLETARQEKELQAQESAKQIESLSAEKVQLDKKLAEAQLQIDKLNDENAQRTKMNSDTKVEYVCDSPDGVEKDAHSTVLKIKDTSCYFEIHWAVGLSSYSASRVFIKEKNASNDIYHQSIGGAGGFIQIPGKSWYRKSDFAYSKEYVVCVVYQHQNGAQTAPVDADQYSIEVEKMRFKIARNPFVFQLAAKIFTAWRLDKTKGDTSFLLPGLSIGAAYRPSWADDDREVFALRFVVALGPNILSKSVMGTDNTDESNKTRFQVIGGFEFVASKYISVGLAWVVYGGPKDGGFIGSDKINGVPLILISYGELYPTLVP